MPVKKSEFENGFIDRRQVVSCKSFGQIGKDVVARRKGHVAREEQLIRDVDGADVDLDFNGGEILLWVAGHGELVQLRERSAGAWCESTKTYAIGFGF